MKAEYQRILEKAKAKEKDVLKKMQHLAKFRRNGFDETVAKYHRDAFEKIDCLECGNCCRQIGPAFPGKGRQDSREGNGARAEGVYSRTISSWISIPTFTCSRPCPARFWAMTINARSSSIDRSRARNSRTRIRMTSSGIWCGSDTAPSCAPPLPSSSKK